MKLTKSYQELPKASTKLKKNKTINKNQNQLNNKSKSIIKI
jgi:hypothetical protein